MNRKLLTVIVALAALLALVMGNAAAAPTAAESEPNDTMATANPMTIGQWMNGTLPDMVDVDFFNFNAPGPKVLSVARCVDPGKDVNYTRLSLYDAAGTLLYTAGSHEDMRAAQLPAAGSYFLSFENHGEYADAVNYTLVPWYRSGLYEPNETRETATPVSHGVINAALDDKADYDYYRFEGRAGEILDFTAAAQIARSETLYIYVEGAQSGWGGMAVLYGPGSARTSIILPADDIYYVYLGAYNLYQNTPCTEKGAPTPYTLTLARRSLYVTAAAAGNAGGVAFTPSDLMARDAAGQWQLAFDGSDVGIVRPLQAVEWTNDGALLLSLSAPQNVPGVGQVAPADILRFTPSQLGANTQGTLAMWLDGSDVGLAAAGEKIDAIAFSEDGRLLVSLTGSGVAPKHLGGTVAVRDEDLIEFVPTRMGPDTLGTWLMRLDGSLLPKMGAEDVRGAFLPLVEDYITPSYSVLNYLVTVENDYTFRACCYSNVTAKAGDILHVRLVYSNGQLSETDMALRLRAADLRFPRKVSGYADGPGWN